MKVLVACEFSGVVRDAFIERGHDAYSCDLIRCFKSKNYERHIVGDCQSYLKQEWDLVIAHPPCTYLTKASAPFRNRKGRKDRMALACAFFLRCLAANSPRVCVENPVMLLEAREMIGTTYTQIIQPYEYGEPESKATCLWLKGLPKLVPTKIVTGRLETKQRLSPSPMRGRLRSITTHGVAKAMAEQWG